MTRLGKHQRAIIARLRGGAELYNDSGMWGWRQIVEGREFSGRLVASSCVSLFQRGLIYEVDRQPGMAAFGGERVVYGLSEKGKAAE